jgi:diketogulonate reductase-like aldo/keto reductase
VDSRPETLVHAAHRSLDALGVDCIDLLQLYSPDVRVPFAESVGALAKLREQGKAKYVGLCNVSVAQIEEARRVTPIASVQNRWNVNDRRPETEGVLDYCVQNGIAFLAYSPFGGTLGAPSLGTHGRIAEEARRRRVTPYRLVLAWMLAKCPVAITIAGARRLESISDSAAAGNMQLGPSDIKAIETALKAAPPQPVAREPSVPPAARGSAPPAVRTDEAASEDGESSSEELESTESEETSEDESSEESTSEDESSEESADETSEDSEDTDSEDEDSSSDDESEEEEDEDSSDSEDD